MKRLGALLLVFALIVALPLALLITRAFHAMAAEERAALRVAGEALFDAVEAHLAGLLAQEEARPVEAYAWRAPGAGMASPADLPADPFIVGYLQNNPDGSFQTPLVTETRAISPALRERYEQIEAANRAFNLRRLNSGIDTPPPIASPAPADTAARIQETQAPLLSPRRSDEPRERLGRPEKRLETVTAGQLRQLAPELAQPAAPASAGGPAPEIGARRERQPAKPDTSTIASAARGEKATIDATAELVTPPVHLQRPPIQDAAPPSTAGGTGPRQPATMMPPASSPPPPDRFQVEVAPFQSVFLTPGRLFVFRRVMLGNHVFRQGLLVDTALLLRQLLDTHFAGQPLARLARLELRTTAGEGWETVQAAGAELSQTLLTMQRVFPAPFAALRAQLQVAPPPPTGGRRALTGMTAALAAVFVAGLVAIWIATRAVVALSERRAHFVAAVTHELRTPLTSIRLYAEMLQGRMAPTAEKADAYLGIIASESGRLSRLIDTVLAFSQLENTKPPALHHGMLTEVLESVQSLMAAQLQQEGFSLRVHGTLSRPATYDREGLIQALLSILDNSVKFGRQAERREISIHLTQSADAVRLAVSDTGPGLASDERHKIFRDFYRGRGELSRATGGMGIGLAMVRRRVHAMGGRVWADNHAGTAGCTITIELPCRPAKTDTAS